SRLPARGAHDCYSIRRAGVGQRTRPHYRGRLEPRSGYLDLVMSDYQTDPVLGAPQRERIARLISEYPAVLAFFSPMHGSTKTYVIQKQVAHLNSAARSATPLRPGSHFVPAARRMLDSGRMLQLSGSGRGRMTLQMLSHLCI